MSFSANAGNRVLGALEIIGSLAFARGAAVNTNFRFRIDMRRHDP
jgi:hypothetical protein